MEDDHVDRPGVEAQQCVQLTGTNRSFGLIALVAKAREKSEWEIASSGWKSVHLATPYSPFAYSKIQFCFGKRSSPAWWPSARRSDPIPSRTRPSNASAPMVLCLKTRESRSSPGLPRTFAPRTTNLEWEEANGEWPIAKSEKRPYLTNASTRAGPPEPFSSLMGATTTIAPAGGTCERLATFSTW